MKIQSLSIGGLLFVMACGGKSFRSAPAPFDAGDAADSGADAGTIDDCPPLGSACTDVGAQCPFVAFPASAPVEHGLCLCCLSGPDMPPDWTCGIFDDDGGTHYREAFIAICTGG